MPTQSAKIVVSIRNRPPGCGIKLAFSNGMKLAILMTFAAITTAGVLNLPPIQQDPNYHHFADSRDLLGLQNGLNAATNLPFLVLGLIGLCTSRNWPARAAWVGSIAIAFGSTWYHSAPSNQRLVWDRLPMAFTFLSFLAVLLQQRIGKNLLLPLIAFGVWSVWYWQATGDLRPYVLAQFFPLLAVPLILILFPGDGSKYWCWTIGIYALAKLCEFGDVGIWKFTHETLSGHSLKHLLAAAALIPLVSVTEKKHGHDAGQSGFGKMHFKAVGGMIAVLVIISVRSRMGGRVFGGLTS